MAPFHAWPSIAFIGSAGIPNRYGGFESFLENVTPQMVRQGQAVLVTCDARLYGGEAGGFKGVERIFINLPANGGLSPLHDMLAFLRVAGRVDVVVVLGVSAGPFFPFMRIAAALLGRRLVVNIDGVEWRRAKFGVVKRWLLRSFDALAQVSAHAVVYDNPALLEFVHPAFRHKAHYIAYSGDHVQRLPADTSAPRTTALTICRIEPENNLGMLIEGALASDLTRYTIIGNWNHGTYGQALREKYHGQARIEMLDPVYDPAIIARWREDCAVYLHGHSVGGTNPSLVEMLFYDAAILCFDCSFNRATAGARAVYFSNSAQLARCIDQSLLSGPKQHEPPAEFTAERIAARYLAVTASAGPAR